MKLIYSLVNPAIFARTGQRDLKEVQQKDVSLVNSDLGILVSLLSGLREYQD